ncbi:two component transcriptional regulator, winged helix family [Nitrosomonas eutropha]|uniref:response regulator n=1 Tax=Nitrosomonas TaxID=914 RepID=UPI000898FEE0|nr:MULTISPECIES: response regulator [Nitrosomonas]MXS80306.1 response regulator [Nitrosomonas sp. GH22]SDW31251.1 two component transcriptional regulator, winged helix family [Nitrosomonas eutropha]
MRILVVEDDSLVASGIKQGLTNAGYTVDVANTAGSAEIHLRDENFDLVVVDIGLPDMDGLMLVQRLRNRQMRLPVLVLTARGSMEDTIAGLDVGADDYMVKPFRLPELAARIRALIRRAHSVASTELRHDQLILNTGSHTATLHGQPLFLTMREWTILEILLMASPKVVSKDKLLQSLAGWDKNITPNAIEVHVSRLRAKIALGGIGIRTVRGIGYRIDQSLS